MHRDIKLKNGCQRWKVRRKWEMCRNHKYRGLLVARYLNRCSVFRISFKKETLAVLVTQKRTVMARMSVLFD